MKLNMKVLVREVRRVDHRKDGTPLAEPFEVLSAVDMETGGDVKLSFPTEFGPCPVKAGYVGNVEAVVRGRLSGYEVALSVQGFSASPAK